MHAPPTVACTATGTSTNPSRRRRNTQANDVHQFAAIGLAFGCAAGRDAEEAFVMGDTPLRKRVARAIGETYVLTLGTLHITPNPLLVLLMQIEPVEIGSRKQELIDFHTPSQLWWTLGGSNS